MAVKKNVEVQDHEGNIYYPHTAAKVVFLENGMSLEEQSADMATDIAGKSDNTHNHDTTYAPKTHTHDYSPSNHNHSGVYAPNSHTHDYASSSHSHDDRYYTESEMNTKLNEKENNLAANQKHRNTFSTATPSGTNWDVWFQHE